MTPERKAEIEALADPEDYNLGQHPAVLRRCAAIRDLLAELPEWRPIETAPKDADIEVDLWCVFNGRSFRLTDMHWCETGRCWTRQGEAGIALPEYVTHYRLAPGPPSHG